jgi:hypothetical protein
MLPCPVLTSLPLPAPALQVLGRGTELVSEQTGRQMVALLQQLQASVPQQLVMSTVQELSDKHQANFKTYMNGSVPSA